MSVEAIWRHNSTRLGGGVGWGGGGGCMITYVLNKSLQYNHFKKLCLDLVRILATQDIPFR